MIRGTEARRAQSVATRYGIPHNNAECSQRGDDECGRKRVGYKVADLAHDHCAATTATRVSVSIVIDRISISISIAKASSADQNSLMTIPVHHSGERR